MSCCGQNRNLRKVVSPVRASRIQANPSDTSAVGRSDATGLHATSISATTSQGASISSTPIPNRTVSPARSAVGSSVAIRYLQRPRILVLGPVSGKQYEFSVGSAIQVVDSRDVAGLLRTGFFSRS